MLKATNAFENMKVAARLNQEVDELTRKVNQSST